MDADLSTGEVISIPADGVLSNKSVYAFSMGQCPALALAIAEKIGSTHLIMIYGYESSNLSCICWNTLTITGLLGGSTKLGLYPVFSPVDSQGRGELACFLYHV